MRRPRPDASVTGTADDGPSVPSAEPSPVGAGRRRGPWWTAAAVVEVVISAAVVVTDVLVPTLVILVLVGASLAARREGPGSLGLRRWEPGGHLPVRVLGWTVAWSAVQLAVIMPTLEHLTGTRQDLSDFAHLQGDVGQLVVLLVLSWTVAALGEEIVYRGYLPTRITDVFGRRVAGTVVAVAASSALFGLAHTEQGLVGVVVTALDAVFFSVLRIHYRTLWASVLAHGFNNTIGLVTFFVVGPLRGLW